MSVSDSPLRYNGRPSTVGHAQPASLAELLERILDKGIVIAGDISISLVDIELLTIKLRLLITSVDKAREIGVNWWESDPWLSARAQEQSSVERPESEGRSMPSRVDERLDRIESALAELTAGGRSTGTRSGSSGSSRGSK